MPVTRYRITTEFAMVRDGWSESLHTTYTSRSNINTLVDAYLTARLNCAQSSVTVLSVRVSDDVQFRDILFYPNWIGARGALIEPAAPPYVALNYRMAAGPLIFRNFFLRGLPRAIVNARIIDTGYTHYGSFTAFRDFLKGNGVGINSKPPRTDAKMVKDYDPSDGTFTLTGAIPGMANDLPLVLTKVPRSIVGPRIWRVATTTAGDVFTLQKWPLAVNIKNFGFFRSAVPTIENTTDCQIRAVTERRVGRPFGLLRGRAPLVR